MDKMIQDIIALDHKQAKAVQDAKQAKALAREKVNARKKEIYDELYNEYQKTIDAKKAELKKSIEDTKIKNEADFKAQVENLTSLYNENKDKWIKTMVESCIK